MENFPHWHGSFNIQKVWTSLPQLNCEDQPRKPRFLFFFCNHLFSLVIASTAPALYTAFLLSSSPYFFLFKPNFHTLLLSSPSRCVCISLFFICPHSTRDVFLLCALFFLRFTKKKHIEKPFLSAALTRGQRGKEEKRVLKLLGIKQILLQATRLDWKHTFCFGKGMHAKCSCSSLRGKKQCSWTQICRETNTETICCAFACIHTTCLISSIWACSCCIC